MYRSFLDGMAQEAVRFAKDRTLVCALLKDQKKRINRVRRTLGWDESQWEEMQTNAETAIFLAYSHARLNRFMKEKDISHDWILEQRRDPDTPSFTGNDRTWDAVLVHRKYPEFETFVPDPPIDEQEVFTLARKEFYDLLCSYGTDYRERLKHDLITPRPEAFYDDPETAFDLQELSEEDILGPSITHVCMKAVDLLGPRLGLYYVFEKLFFAGKHTALLQKLGGKEVQKLTPKEFEAVRRDLNRKLNNCGDFDEIMRNDPEFLELLNNMNLRKPKSSLLDYF